MKSTKTRKKHSEVNNLIRYSNLGFEMLGIMAVCIFIGFSLDKWLHLKYIFTGIGVLCSVFAALYYAIRKIK